MKADSGVWAPTYGAAVVDGGVRFRVWAPRAEQVRLILGEGSSQRVLSMEPRDGAHEVTADMRGALSYRYSLDGGPPLPDPASLGQPEGVHGSSQVVDAGAFGWHDGEWKGVGLRDLVMYELHVGTFTSGGTFGEIVPRLGHFKRLGVTALELMPVAQFPGTRDWGYDGVYPYATQSSYGGAKGLAALVDACHAEGLGVILDVVYNHLGPEGNYLARYGPYFSQRHRTPWGEGVNFDGPDSGPVRRYFIDNALHWVRSLHMDGLRLDAVHGIKDSSSKHILQELEEEVQRAAAELGREVDVIAESDLNDPKLVRRREEGGYGLDAQWSDDLHHALHVSLTGERFGYYQDFGGVADLAKAFAEPFVIDGKYSSYRGRKHGAPTPGIPGYRFVVFAQNHDQVGNRVDGARLTTLVGPDSARAAAAAVILSPYLPLLFMGEEYGERAPFYFFTEYGDRGVAEATREGRRRELESQGGKFIDPQDPGTFEASRPDQRLAQTEEGSRTLGFYSSLLTIRRQHPAARAPRTNTEVACFQVQNALQVRRWEGTDELLLVLVLSGTAAELRSLGKSGSWSLSLSSAEGAPPRVTPGSVDRFPGPSASVYLRR